MSILWVSVTPRAAENPHVYGPFSDIKEAADWLAKYCELVDVADVQFRKGDASKMKAAVPANSDQAFESFWEQRWAPQVEGNFFSRRWEPQIKSAAKDVWDEAVKWMSQGK